MGLIRMFHYSCDSYLLTQRPYVRAKEEALAQGWHINATHAICPLCWEAGIRFRDFSK